MMKRQNIRTLFLIIGTFTYLLCGASFFDFAESKHEKMQRTALDTIEKMIINKYNISQNDFRILTTVVIKNVPHKAGVQWKFSGAFYFATTVLTTIGYGHSTPATYLGKSFCMLYALMGIPLGLIMFQSIGERLNTFVAYSLRFCKRCLRFKQAESAKDINSIQLSDKCLIISVSIISTLVMTIGAAVFAHWESWSYFDAFYYCFITLTTIGFGDYVALQKNSALQDKPEYVIFSLVFILFGLSVVSAAINLLVLRFLTMNTEDERRDEAEAALTAASGVRLEGDVITANGSMISGIIPMENYLHNTAHPFSSRYHVYNYQSNSGKKKKRSFSKSNKFRRTANQLEEQDDLFSGQDEFGLDEDTIEQRQIAYYDNHENMMIEHEASEITETSSSQLNKAYKFQKESSIISDSAGSDRAFNTHLNHLKAHHLQNSEASELSLGSSGRASHRKSLNKRSKIFSNNHLLSKQQRKNYKHMVSDDDDEDDDMVIGESNREEANNSELMSNNEPAQLQTADDLNDEEDDDRASVCSCTCYGNNQSSGWRKSGKNSSGSKKTTKTTKSNQMITNLDDQKSLTPKFILNRKAALVSSKKQQQRKMSKQPIRLSSNVKYKNIKTPTSSAINIMSGNKNRFNQLTDVGGDQFDLNQLNRFNDNQYLNQDAILQKSIYYQHPYTIDQTNPTIINHPIIADNLISNRAIYFSNNLDHQQRPFLVMQSSNRLNQAPNQLSTSDSINQQHDQFICNSDQLLLNHLNAKNMAQFLDNNGKESGGQSNNQSLNEQNKQIIELNEKQFIKKHQQSNELSESSSRKDKKNHQLSTAITNKSSRQQLITTTTDKESNEYLLAQYSNDAFVVKQQQQQQQQQPQFMDSIIDFRNTPTERNENRGVGDRNDDGETKSDLLILDQDKLSTQRASI